MPTRQPNVSYLGQGRETQLLAALMVWIASFAGVVRDTARRYVFRRAT